MASPGNQHCANCIGTLSIPIGPWGVDMTAPRRKSTPTLYDGPEACRIADEKVI